MIACKPWRGDDLRGAWAMYRKLDDVRALVMELPSGDHPGGAHAVREDK